MITNQINGKIYIGQTKDPVKRWKKHKEKRKNPIQLIHLAIVKYGIENFVFEIIATVLQDSDIDNMEIIVIEQHKSRVKEIGYNIHAGGKLKFDYVNKDKNTYNSGRFVKGQIGITKDIKLTDERKLHLSLINKGKKHSKETKDKMSESHKGRISGMKDKKQSDSAKAKISKNNKGKKHSKETKDKISKKNSGKIRSEKQKSDQSKRLKGRTWKIIDGKRVWQ